MPTQSSDYNVAEAFRRIERELIDSMIKNMKRHLDWENDEGFQWEMWQALQLQALEKYRRENPDKFRGEFEDVNAQIAEIIEEARQNGQLDQEVEILDAIQKGWKPPALDEGLSGMFFRINDRKMDALISATTHDFEKAEAAILRKANDNYRKVIFSAQMYANSGAATYEKAVDMATKDFLAAGINCIEYKNGSRHTLQDYCDMALRTAQKRAYLAGEGEKRQEWGIHTVIMNKRGQGQPCPLCLPFVGKIMIDDVYGGGSRKDGPYKLLSEAMAAGLYHPRCRDSHTAYFPDIDEEEKLTRKEVQKTKEEYMAEEEANYCSRQEEKYGRLAEHSLDPENQRKYAARRDAWGEKAERLQMKLDTKAIEPNESGRLKRMKRRAAEKERLADILKRSVTIGKPYVKPEKIRSAEFSRKFSDLTDDSRINDRIRSLAQGNITKNNGTYTEMLDVIDLDTGESVVRKVGERNAMEVALSPEERATVREHKGRIVGIHNHPTNIYPTGSDFVTAAARGYEFGIIVTHDLRVFKYTGPKIVIKPEAIDEIIDKQIKMAYTDDDKSRGFERAMKELEGRYGITWEEV